MRKLKPTVRVVRVSPLRIEDYGQTPLSQWKSTLFSLRARGIPGWSRGLIPSEYNQSSAEYGTKSTLENRIKEQMKNKMESPISPHPLLFKSFWHLQEKRQNQQCCHTHCFWGNTEPWFPDKITVCEVWYILKFFVTIHRIIQMASTLQTPNIFMLAGLSMHFCYKKLGGLLQIISKE